MGLNRFARHGTSIYKTNRWKAVRQVAKRRDGWQCTECGASGRLEVHHKIPVRKAPELAYDLANLQTLCVPCHSRRTRLEIGLGREDPERDRWKALLKTSVG